MGHKKGVTRSKRAAKELSNLEPPITHIDPPIDHDRLPRAPETAGPSTGCFWPAGKPMPKTWHRAPRQSLPCPKCRRLLLDDRGQAVVCASSGTDIAYFRCRACGHRWALAVERR